MIRSSIAALTLTLALTVAVTAQNAPVKVLVQTEMGDIILEVDAAKDALEIDASLAKRTVAVLSLRRYVLQVQETRPRRMRA